MRRFAVLLVGGLLVVPPGCSGGDSDGSRGPKLDGSTDSGTDAASDASDSSAADSSGESDAHDASLDASGFNSQVVSLAPDTYVESEPAIATGPAERVAVAWIAYLTATQEARIGYAFSSDGGAHFTQPKLINGPLAGSESGDPSVVFDANGQAYLTWLGFMRNGPETDDHVYVATSAPGTDTFGTPVQVDQDGSADKPWAIIGSNGQILVTWTRGFATGLMGVSSDGAKTFNESTVVTAPFVNMLFPCLSPNGGHLYVVYVLETTPPDAAQAEVSIETTRSDNLGSAWTTPVAVYDPSWADPPSADAPTCVADDSGAWFTFGTGTDPAPSDASTMPRSKALWVAHVGGSVTIDKRVLASDSLGGDRYMHPTLARTPTGAIHLSYFAGAEPDDGKASVRWTRSNDDGATWSASVPLSASNLHLLIERANVRWLGDYMSLAMLSPNLLAAYASNEGTASHIVVAQAPLQ